MQYPPGHYGSAPYEVAHQARVGGELLSLDRSVYVFSIFGTQSLLTHVLEHRLELTR